MSSETVTLDDVYRARASILEHVHRTPLLHSSTLSGMTGSDLWLKAENLQRTGAYKVRGGLTAALSLTDAERRAGLIAVSAGNHAAAVAYGARMAGTRATLVMPEGAVQAKIDTVGGYGGDVVLVDPHGLMESMEEIRSRSGATFIHPFDHPAMVAGAGTVGLEILEDLKDVEVMVVPVGGGGLISGIVTAVKAIRPSVRVYGVEPEGSTAVGQSLEAGHPLRLQQFASIADGLNAPWSGPLTLGIIRRFVDGMVTVSDDAIARATVLIVQRMKLLTEPAGAAGVAALLEGVIPDTAGRRVVTILSGGNIDVARLAEFVR